MRDQPHGYLITWTIRGAWRHGDARLSVDRRSAVFGSSMLASGHRPGTTRVGSHARTLLVAERDAIERAIACVCEHREWTLRAANARSNHVRVVASGGVPPEMMLKQFKAWATRSLREIDADRWAIEPWTRHGSTRYLWSRADVSRAVKYTLQEQDRSERYADGPSEPRS